MFQELSHRDYWVVKLDNGMALLVSRSSATGTVLVSLLDGDAVSPPQEATFNPDDLSVGTVLGSETGKQYTVTKVTMIPRMAVTARRTP